MHNELEKDVIAFEGSEFIIEWYYGPNNKSQAHEYYEALSPAQQKKLSQLFFVLGETGSIRNETKFHREGNLFIL